MNYCNFIRYTFGLLSFLWLNQTLFSQNLFEVQSLEFNTRDYKEYAPVIYQDGIVFISDKPKDLIILNRNLYNDIFIAHKQKENKWSVPEAFSNELNSRFNEGPVTFSKDGNTIFFTRYQDSSSYVYKASKVGGTWENVTPITLCSNKYNIKDPCLSPDGKKLFFACNKKEGFGGYDIYVSTFERGDWSEPKNLGPLVNTPGNEVTPFMHPNGRLYFASNKLPGLGKLDIFYTREINGKWITPRHLPAPINSPRDDLAYYSEALDTTGYFTSNRSRSDDIFSFRSLWPKWDECKPLEKNDYTFLLEDVGSVNNDTTTYLYEWDFGDGSKIKTKDSKVLHTFPQTGKYLIQMNLVDTITGMLISNESTYEFEVNNIEQAYITAPDSVNQNTEVKLDAKQTNLPKFGSIAGYYWDFGDGEKEVGPETTHTYYLPGKYTIQLGVISAPDENGKTSHACVTKEIIVLPSAP